MIKSILIGGLDFKESPLGEAIEMRGCQGNPGKYFNHPKSCAPKKKQLG